MKMKFYFKKNLKAICFAFIGLFAAASVSAQIYTDSTGLIADIEAGIYEEYVLAPATVDDTIFLAGTIYPTTSFVLKAQDGLGFMPVVSGDLKDTPGYVFMVEGIDGGADMDVEGLKFAASIGEQEAIEDGLFRIQSEDINITVKNCEFYDFQGYNTIAKVYNSGGDITLENVLTKNTAGKIIQVNYKDDDATPNYVPKIGDLTVTNCTFIDNYKRIFFELGAGDVPIDETDPNVKQRFNAGAENVIIDHCTFFRHSGVNVMQGRSKYEFAGDMAAIEGKLSITNSVFSAMDENLNADSAAQVVLDNNYFDFGLKLDEGDVVDDLVALWSATNILTTAPTYADTAAGAWDLTLQNEADIIGGDGTPIGDERWWQQEWNRTSVKNTIETSIANIYSYSDRVIIESEEQMVANVSVFDITGRLVHERALNANRAEIQLSHGLYIVRLSSVKGDQVKKVVIGR